jgi:CubicO group peptidase (beta-lactamase class C family)
MIIVGDVIAKVSGEPFEEYMQKHILTPLGMTQSTLYPQAADPELQASPHVVKLADPEVSELVTFSREHAPSVGLLTNMEDLNRFAVASLNRGELNGERILEPSTHDELWKPTTPTMAGEGSDFKLIGLGWLLGDNVARPVRQFPGRDVGFHSQIYLAPEQNLGIVVLGNQWTGVGPTVLYGYTVASTIADLILAK